MNTTSPPAPKRRGWLTRLLDASDETVAELVAEHLGGGRIYGIYRPPLVAAVDLGGGDDEDDEDVPLSFDNTLGSQAPAFVEYVAVAGELDELPVGMTLVELPPDAGPPVAAADEGLRGQLVQAQRQAELAAIDRQALLEKVDELESAQSELEHQAAELRDHLARAVTEAEAEAAHDDRLQSSLADNQALRWKVQQLERELEEAKARPVEALEAEVAELRARLEAEAEADADEADDVESDADEADADDRVEAEDVDGLDEILVLDSDDEAVDDAEALAERIRMGGALRDLDRLIARVERGGIGALQLRQALVGLRKRLRG